MPRSLWRPSRKATCMHWKLNTYCSLKSLVDFNLVFHRAPNSTVGNRLNHLSIYKYNLCCSFFKFLELVTMWNYLANEEKPQQRKRKMDDEKSTTFKQYGTSKRPDHSFQPGWLLNSKYKELLHFTERMMLMHYSVYEKYSSDRSQNVDKGCASERLESVKKHKSKRCPPKCDGHCRCQTNTSRHNSHAPGIPHNECPSIRKYENVILVVMALQNITDHSPIMFGLAMLMKWKVWKSERPIAQKKVQRL